MNNSLTQWEYKKLGDCEEEELNKLGKEGWEAVGIDVHEGTLLKRPLTPQRSTSSDTYGYGR